LQQTGLAAAVAARGAAAADIIAAAGAGGCTSVATLTAVCLTAAARAEPLQQAGFTAAVATVATTIGATRATAATAAPYRGAGHRPSVRGSGSGWRRVGPGEPRRCY